MNSLLAPTVATREPLARQIPLMESEVEIKVSSPAFAAGGIIPVKYAACGGNVSLPLSWEVGPGPTQSYVIFMEDPDASFSSLPAVHWLLWNIHADTLSLDENLSRRNELSKPSGLRQGINAKGQPGYLGPDPPGGDAAHDYHIQVFALDCILALTGPISRQQLLAACEDHVLASGVLVGRFSRSAAAG